MGFSFNFGYNNKPTVEIDNSGNVFYSIMDGLFGKAKKISDKEKLSVVCSNPALLKVIALDCDIFSLGKINKYEDDKVIENDFLYSITKKPNLLQSWTQFNWDYKFWLNIYGVAQLYNPNDSKILSENTSLQWLDPSKIIYNDSIIKKLQAFVFSKKSLNEIKQGTITYNFGNGESKVISLKEISSFYDLTNAGQSNPLIGISRVDALYKVINNSELAMDAKGINLFLSGRVLVAGKADPSKTDFSNIPMGEDEKQSIEQKVLSNKNVHAVKSMVDIKRFVDNIGALKLDESFVADFMMFGSMFNIPKEILDAVKNGSTYENQEKAMARLIEYCEAPKAQMLTDWMENQYDLQDIRMSWSHLMFMQVFEKEKIEIQQIKALSLLSYMQAGVKLEEINELLGTKFTYLDYAGLKVLPKNTNN